MVPILEVFIIGHFYTFLLQLQYFNNNISESISQPYFDYCAQVWGCLGKTLAAKLQKLQNRAFRIITLENYSTRSADILNKLGIPNPDKRRMQQLSILMYKVKNRLVPEYLCDMFTNVGDVHDHNTRQSGANLTLPKPKMPSPTEVQKSGTAFLHR